VHLVLIVDDNEQNAKLVRDVLEAAGIRTLSAATAGEGIDLAIQHRPDLVLMDLRLPDFDGEEAAQRLKADERTRSIPIVALSALDLHEAGVRLGDEGFAGSIEKPIDVRELPAQVRRFCSH
jgi:CheY-like chemotaxis protein